MYEWLETEISEIKTTNFFVMDGNKAGHNLPVLKDFDSCLPPSYLAFINKFGSAKLYRINDYYQVGVLNPPQEKILNNGERLLLIGHFDDAKAYLICSQLISGIEAPIYEWTEDGFEKISNSFEEWLTMRCKDAREIYDENEWKEILNEPKPFTEEEKAIVEARRQFQWQVLEFSPNRNVKFAVKNNSELVLPYLTIGMRTKNPTKDGQVWESGIYLNVSDIQPGQNRIIKHLIPQHIFTSDNTEFFELVVPVPEERDKYWEFSKLTIKEKTYAQGKT